MTTLKNNVLPVFLNFINYLVSLFNIKWVPGRLGTGYYKKLLLESERFNFDVYLLKFPEGSYADKHRDYAPEGYEHHRINMLLNENFSGGKFIMNSKAQTGRAFRFRPDKFTHRVSKVKEGTRYVLSIGWLKKEQV